MKSPDHKTSKGHRRKPEAFDKYWYYRKSVQGPEGDVEFLTDTYKRIRKKRAKDLREDFCGTFAISCEWVKLHRDHEAVGVDLDPEPLAYGREHYLTGLSEEQQSRLKTIQADVLSPSLPKADIICAMNFSHYVLKERWLMKRYFENCRAGLKDDGILLIDSFGGSRCHEANEEQTRHKGWIYYWDQDSFDPITNHAVFYIHFKPDGSKKIEKVFTYDWRMWSIPELREIMTEAGFRNTTVYWEGTTKNGEGDGVFKPATKGEECEAWIAYIVGEK